jgi:hypothetical protein
MIRVQNPNLQILELAVDRLGDLTNEMVFLGGCATGLLMTDPAAPPIRVTQDVDVITEVATLAAYHRLSRRLREKEFSEDQSPDAPICRWVAPGVVLDIIAVLDGRPELVEELRTADDELRKHLAGGFGELLANEDFLAAVPGHLQGGGASPDRTPVVVGIIEEIADFA